MIAFPPRLHERRYPGPIGHPIPPLHAALRELAMRDGAERGATRPAVNTNHPPEESDRGR